jgi:hypothetical protein
VFVWQRVVHRLNLRHGTQDHLCHVVHGCLNAGAVLLGKSVESDFSGSTPSIIEASGICLNLAHVFKELPSPCGINLGAQNAIPNLWQGSVFVAHKAPELRSSAFEDVQAGNTRRDLDAFALSHIDLDISSFGAIAQERMRVRLAVDGHASPPMGYDADVGDVDVAVLFNKVRANNRAKELWRGHWVLFGQDKDGVLDRVCGNDNAVISLGVSICGILLVGIKKRREKQDHIRGFNVSFQQTANCHLHDGLHARLLVAMDLVNADIVLAVAGSTELGGHDKLF